jgi:hypothetical protein
MATLYQVYRGSDSDQERTSLRKPDFFLNLILRDLPCNYLIHINFISNTLHNTYKYYGYYKQNKYCATWWKQNLRLLVFLFHCDVAGAWGGLVVKALRY